MQCKNNGRIGCVITTYNDSEFLCGTISTLLAQTVRPDEIIVVDDGSDELHLNIIKSCVSSKLVPKSIKLKICFLPHGGAPKARNYGVHQLGEIEYIHIAEADGPYLSRKAIESLKTALKDSEEADFSYGQCVFVYVDRVTVAGKQYAETSLLEGNYIPFVALIRSDKWVGQDESLLRLQDWDMWLKMLSKRKEHKRSLKNAAVLVPYVMRLNLLQDGRISYGTFDEGLVDKIKSKYPLLYKEN